MGYRSQGSYRGMYRNESTYMNIHRLKVTFAVSALLICCQTDFARQTISIKMLGVFEEPAYLSGNESCNDATADSNGWFEPLNQSYTLLRISLNYTDPDTAQSSDLVLFEDDPQEYRITYRTQRIFKKELSESSLGVDLVGKTINSLRISFSSGIVGQSKHEEDHSISLGSGPSGDGVSACSPGVAQNLCLSDDETGQCSASYAQPFLVGKGQSYSFVIKVQWKRTVNRIEQGGNLSDISMLTPTLSVAESEN